MSRAPAIELAPGVFRIPTTPGDLINVFAFVDPDGQVTLIDCGLRTAPKRILAAFEWIGTGPSDVTRIVLTHAHGDHAGGLSRMRGRTGAPVAVHEREADYLRTGNTPVRDRATTTTGRVLRRIPDVGFSPIEVSQELVDGQVLDVGGGLEVVHTPGHTPGHISLVHQESGVLITGDALFNWRSRITWPLLTFCTDAALTRETASRLADLKYDVVAFTHGPEIRDNAREAVRDFLRGQRVAL
jgi:glyoxylase-like metal-dependent hydrolase (beta-lactamase superfamily II)